MILVIFLFLNYFYYFITLTYLYLTIFLFYLVPCTSYIRYHPRRFSPSQTLQIEAPPSRIFIYYAGSTHPGYPSCLTRILFYFLPSLIFLSVFLLHHGSWKRPRFQLLMGPLPQGEDCLLLNIRFHPP